MIAYETFLVALRSLRSHPLRTFLTLLGVIIGVMTVVTVVSLIGGLNAYVKDTVLTLGGDVFVVSKMGLVLSRDEFLDSLKRKDVTLEEFETVKGRCRRCLDVGGNVTATKAVRHESKRLNDVTINGATANMAALGALDVELGRYITDSEVALSRRVAVIGADVREELFAEVDPIGRSIRIDQVPYKVVGLLVKEGSVFGQTQDKEVHVPITAFIENFGTRRSVDIYVKAGTEEAMTETQDEVRAIMRGLRRTPYHDDDPFSLVTSGALQGLWASISVGAFSLMVVISTISLVVGGIVIMNIMLVSVAERTHEIGVRMAHGARRRTIMLQFILEAALMAAAGGAVGAFVGALVGAAIEWLTPIPVLVDAPVIALALGLATVVGIVSGVGPSIKASRLSPVECLRQEQ